MLCSMLCRYVPAALAHMFGSEIGHPGVLSLRMINVGVPRDLIGVRTGLVMAGVWLGHLNCDWSSIRKHAQGVVGG